MNGPTRTPRPGRARGIAMLVVASTLWSLGGVMVKLAHLPPLGFTFYRSLAAGLATLALVPLFPGRRPPLRWMALSIVLYTGVVSFVVTAMTAATAAAGILLEYTAPVWCALFGWLLLRRRIDNRTAVALVSALVGIAIMIAGGHRVGWLGPLCGMASGVCFGGLILVLDKFNATTGGPVNPTWIVALNNLGAAMLLLPVTLARSELAAPPAALVAVMLTGIVQLAIPYVVFQFALRRVSAIDASLLTLLEPVLNPVWVAAITGEVPDAATFVGGGAILAAMVVEATKPNDPPDDK